MLVLGANFHPLSLLEVFGKWIHCLKGSICQLKAGEISWGSILHFFPLDFESYFLRITAVLVEKENKLVLVCLIHSSWSLFLFIPFSEQHLYFLTCKYTFGLISLNALFKWLICLCHVKFSGGFCCVWQGSVEVMQCSCPAQSFQVKRYFRVYWVAAVLNTPCGTEKGLECDSLCVSSLEFCSFLNTSAPSPPLNLLGVITSVSQALFPFLLTPNSSWPSVLPSSY